MSGLALHFRVRASASAQVEDVGPDEKLLLGFLLVLGQYRVLQKKISLIVSHVTSVDMLRDSRLRSPLPRVRLSRNLSTDKFN